MADLSELRQLAEEAAEQASRARTGKDPDIRVVSAYYLKATRPAVMLALLDVVEAAWAWSEKRHVSEEAMDQVSEEATQENVRGLATAFAQTKQAEAVLLAALSRLEETP